MIETCPHEMITVLGIRCYVEGSDGRFGRGTSFVVGDENRHYLVTVGHISEGCDLGKQVDIYARNNWHTLPGHWLERNPETDIAVYRIDGIYDFRPIPLDCLKSSSLEEGEEVSVWGFPKSESEIDDSVLFRTATAITGTFWNMPYSVPERSESLLLFRGHSYEGVSGGPICLNSPGNNSGLVVGAVLQGGNQIQTVNGPGDFVFYGCDSKYAVESILQDD
jgi:hypothetical protein